MLKVEHFHLNDKPNVVVTDTRDNGETIYSIEFYTIGHAYYVWIYAIIDNGQPVLYESTPDAFLALSKRLDTKISSTQLEAFPNQTVYYADGSGIPTHQA